MNDKLFTIGFTQKTAAQFFELIRVNAIQKLVDTRLNNSGQLAGFSKKDDLKYFCKELVGAEYFHWEESAPTSDILDAYKKKIIPWDEYAKEYEALLSRRRIESQFDTVLGERVACLLCSEAKPHHCHRSILAKYISNATGRSVSVHHLT